MSDDKRDLSFRAVVSVGTKGSTPRTLHARTIPDLMTEIHKSKNGAPGHATWYILNGYNVKIQLYARQANASYKHMGDYVFQPNTFEQDTAEAA